MNRITLECLNNILHPANLKFRKVGKYYELGTLESYRLCYGRIILPSHLGFEITEKGE